MTWKVSGALLLSLGLSPHARSQIQFGAPQEISNSITTGIGHCKASDLDGDGDLDVIVAEKKGHRVLWWLNDGSGGFSDAQVWEEHSGQTNATVVALEDLNDDDRLDILLKTSIEESVTNDGVDWGIEFRASLNSGFASFDSSFILTPNKVTERSAIDPEFLSFDLNRDGLLEIFTGSKVWTLTSSLELEEVGTLPWAPYYDLFPLWDEATEIAFVDFDLDGDADVISTPSFFGTLALTENVDGTGFANPEFLLDPDRLTFPVQTVVRSSPFLGLDTFAVLERSEDGSSIEFYRISENKELINIRSIDLPTSHQLADLSWYDFQPLENGNVLALASADNRSRTFTIGSENSLTLLCEFPGTSLVSTASLSNLDEDDVPDLILPVPPPSWQPVPRHSPISWHKGLADGEIDTEKNPISEGFSGRSIIAVVDPESGDRSGVLIGSLIDPESDASGFDQISLEETSDRGLTWSSHHLDLGRDSLKVIAEVDIAGDFLISPPSGSKYSIIAEDGRQDFLVQTLSPRFSDFRSGVHRFEWLLQAQDGTFHLYPLETEDRSSFHAAWAADWNGDGAMDILDYNESNHLGLPELRVRYGQGEEFSNPTTLIGSIKLDGICLEDIDRDGDTDILTSGFLFNGNSSYWFENDGSGKILSIRPYDAPWPLGLDIDSDGNNDYFETIPLTYLKRIFLLDSVQRLIEMDGPIPQNPELTFIDIDSDGDLDVTYSNPTFGVTTFDRIIWQENVGNMRFEQPQEILGDPRWISPQSFAMMDVDLDGQKDLVLLSPRFPRLEWFKITRTPEPAAFTTAMEALDLRGHSAGPFSDWDLDGMLNWTEFAFGSNAAVPDRNHPGLPALRMTEAGWTYSFQRRMDAAALGLSYDTEHSTNLQDWEPWSPPSATSPPIGGYERVEYPVTFDLEKEFFKVEASDPASAP